jgi:hypothetical protein
MASPSCLLHVVSEILSERLATITENNSVVGGVIIEIGFVPFRRHSGLFIRKKSRGL